MVKLWYSGHNYCTNMKMIGHLATLISDLIQTTFAGKISSLLRHKSTKQKQASLCRPLCLLQSETDTVVIGPAGRLQLRHSDS